MKNVLWQELRRPEIARAAAANAVVIIPVGSTEQHGEHLPINTDANCCFSIAKEAASQVNDFPVLVVPPVWAGYSPHHMDYPGTITLGFHTFVEVLGDIATSISAHGFHNIMFLNGHGGNAPMVNAMRRKLIAEKGISCLGLCYWELPGVADELKRLITTDGGAIGHSGEMETSMELYLQPELVAKDKIQWVSGVKGDPTAGTRAKGEAIFKTVVKSLINVLREYRDGTIEERLLWRKEIPRT